ncbi:MAG: trigger factor [Actinomycetota bacterium]
MKTDALQTTSERVEKDRVKLRVEVAEDALTPAINAAYRRWAGEIKVPGFRKGKVPRQLIDARVGADVVREEALRDALPDLYRDALRAEDLEAIAPPDIDVVDFDPGSPLIFEATVDVRPEIVLPNMSDIEVEAPESDVTEEDVNEQLERLRERFAELETVGRDARRGDFVLIDLKGYDNGEPVEDASAPDFLYEVGSRTGSPRLDDEVEGTRPGVIVRFNDVVATAGDGDGSVGRELSFTVLVKEVKAKKLPVLDDDFAKTVGEFDDLQALKEDLRERLGEVKGQLAEDELRAIVLERLVDAAHLEAPEKLVATEFDHQLEHLEEDLGRAGMTFADYALQSDATELEIRKDIRSRAQRSVKAELLLEEVARRNEIGIEEEEIGREIAVAAARSGRDPQELAKQIVDSGRLSVVAADIMRRKALDYVVDLVNVSSRPAAEESEE